MNCYLSTKHCRRIHLLDDLQGLLLWVISTGSLLAMLLVVSVIKLPAHIVCGPTLLRNNFKR